ncbi:MAG: TlpA family protein disulfide reductase, partial [Terriglobales bacterium]
YRLGERLPIPAGYLVDGHFLAPRVRPCFLLRLATDECPYCRSDAQSLQPLMVAAEAARCETVFLAPKSGTMTAALPNSAMLLQGVGLDLGRVLDPYLIPQTLLLDRGGKIVWFRVGSLAAVDLASAQRALAKLH